VTVEGAPPEHYLYPVVGFISNNVTLSAWTGDPGDVYQHMIPLTAGAEVLGTWFYWDKVTGQCWDYSGNRWASMAEAVRDVAAS